MNLESIVPSLETCRKIPQGAFKDSALVWMAWHTENIEFGKVVPRSMLKEFIGALSMAHAALLYVHPAPTLAEILAELPTCVEVESTGRTFYLAMFDTRNKDGMIQFGYTDSYLTKTKLRERDENPATAALRLWFRMKGVQG